MLLSANRMDGGMHDDARSQEETQAGRNTESEVAQFVNNFQTIFLYSLYVSLLLQETLSVGRELLDSVSENNKVSSFVS